MDHFIVSARKYRPATFHTVVGQQHITGTLKNAIKNNQLAQAFLFCGPRGVGKTTCARILAKTINCQQLTPELEACGSCDSCTSFQNGNSFNVHELDAASNNSVDDIRSLIEQVRIPPQAGKYKIYIVDEVHMLSQAAFNAFLKTLEEPPSYAIFILATTEKHKILPTILSRCQIFDFNRIKVADMASHLASIAQKESIQFDQDGLHLIAQKADGGLRDALSMFDQIVSFSNKNVSYKAVIDNLNILDYDYYFKITDALLSENVSQVLLIFDEILQNGFDGNHFIIGLAAHFRNLLVCKDEATLNLLEVSEGIRAKYHQQSQQTAVSFLLSALNLANQCDINYKSSKNQRLQVELSLIKMCHILAAFNLSVSGTPMLEKKKPEQSVISPVSSVVKSPVIATVSTPELQTSQIKEQQNTPIIAPPIMQANIVVQEKAPLISTPSVGKMPQIPTLNNLHTSSVDRPVLEKELPKPAPNIKPSLIASAASLIPNLQTLSSSKVETTDEPTYVTGDSQQAFSNETFLNLWTSYAQKKKQEGKINLFTMMTSSIPVLLDQTTIQLTIENNIQESQLTVEKIDLLNFLRVELQNFSVDIVTKIAEVTEKRRLYTSTEKYQHMVEKNPQLEVFRAKFDLAVEF